MSEPTREPAPLFARPLGGGSRFVLAPDAVDRQQLVVSMTTQPVTIAARLTREDVQELTQVLDDWLYDSRPRAARTPGVYNPPSGLYSPPPPT